MESQAAMGIERWAENFSSVVVAAPVLPAGESERTSSNWVPASVCGERVQMVELPWSFSARAFAKNFRPTARVLSECIDAATHLQFAIGGLIGDWAGVAAEIALRKGRPFAAHVDRVEHEFILRNMQFDSWKRRLRKRVSSPLMKWWHGRILSRAAVALCHGADCYKQYALVANNPRLIHNIHLTREDAMAGITLQQKMDRARKDSTLRIVYAGRLAAEKGPMEWVRAIAGARDAGAKIEAEWLGDGPARERVEAEIERLDLQNVVKLRGFVKNRDIVAEAIRQAHLFLFAHLTPESPRCLIEALLCATPIVGFESAYSEGLIARHGGGIVAGRGDVDGLTLLLTTLADDRELLALLTERAFADGGHFDAGTIFAERSALIREYAGRPSDVPPNDSQWLRQAGSLEDAVAP